MKMPPRGVQIILALYEANKTLAHGTEDDRRKLTRKIAEQFKFEFGDRWGTKSTSSRAPQSKDAIAYLTSLSPEVMDIWDWQSGSTKLPSIKVNQDPDYPGITDQHFIHVDSINHLDAQEPEEPDNGDDDNDTNDDLDIILAGIRDNLDQIRTLAARILDGQVAILTALQILIDKPIDVSNIEFPEYQATNRFLGAITFKPVKK